MKRTLILAFVALFAIPTASAQSPLELFQQALRLESVQGDLEGAIALYERVGSSFGSDRALGARALFRMGQAYETLGQNDATRTYRRIVSEFADQSETVAMAEAALGRLVASAPAVVDAPKRRPGEVTQLAYAGERDNNEFFGMDRSSDGKFMAFGGEAPFVRNLATNADIDIPVEEGCAASAMRFSPDGESVVHGCWGNGNVRLYDRRTKSVRTILDGRAYMDLTPDQNLGVVVYDWTVGGDSILAAMNSWQTEETILALVPADGGEPRVLLDPYLGAEGGFDEMAACLMADDHVLFYQDWRKDGPRSEQYSIRKLSTRGGGAEVVLSEGSAGFVLLGCDKQRGLLFYQTQFAGINFSLWGARVGNDGSVSDHRKLVDQPSQVLGHPFTDGGNAYYTVRNFEVYDRTWTGRMTPKGARIVGSNQNGMIYDWTDDGRFRAGRFQASGYITDTETGEVTPIKSRVPIRAFTWFPDGKRFMVSYWPNREDAPLQFTRSWIYDLETAAVIDSVNGIKALATSADGESILFSELTERGVCVSSLRLSDRARNEVRCIPEGSVVPETWDGFEMSRSREWMWAAYGFSDSTQSWRSRILSVDGSREFDLPPGPSNVRVEFLPDDSAALIMSWNLSTTPPTGELSRLDLRSGERKPLSTGLPTDHVFRFQGWKVHPDGERFEVWLVEPEPAEGIWMVNRVADLYDSR